MDFIANIIPGAEGASSSKLNIADKSGKTDGDENSLFAVLVSKNGSEPTSATPKADIGIQDGSAQNTAALLGENPVMTGSGSIPGPGRVPGPEHTTGSGHIPGPEPIPGPGHTPGPERIPGSVGIPDLEGVPAPARSQGDVSDIKPALPLKTEADLAGKALKTKSNGLISTWKETMVVRQGPSGGEEKSALNRLDNPFSRLVASKPDLLVKDIATGQPAGSAGKSRIETAPQSGLIAAKADLAKTALPKSGMAAKATPVLKAAPDMDPASSALAVFAKMNKATAGKTGLDAAAVRMAGAEIVKAAEIAAPSSGVESTLNAAAEKPQSFHAILQSHQTEAKPGMLPVNAVAVEIARKFNAGANKFQIRLDPPELGRIDVRMDVSKEGRVTAHMIVEKPETLVALNRDAAALERALNASGLETRENALNFSLSGGNHRFEGEGNHESFGAGDEADVMSTQDIEILNAATTLRGYISSTGVDIHV